MRDFIEATTYANPTAVTPLATLFRQFKARLPEAERSEWPRLRFVTECAKAGLELAVDGNGRTVIVGRSLTPAKRLSVHNGRLVKEA